MSSLVFKLVCNIGSCSFIFSRFFLLVAFYRGKMVWKKKLNLKRCNFLLIISTASFLVFYLFGYFQSSLQNRLFLAVDFFCFTFVFVLLWFQPPRVYQKREKIFFGRIKNGELMEKVRLMIGIGEEEEEERRRRGRER